MREPFTRAQDRRLQRPGNGAGCQPDLVGELITGLSSPKARVKFGAAKALRALSERTPEKVYAHFDILTRFLRHENSILRWNAMLVLANLASIDKDRKLDSILGELLAPIRGKHMIDAGMAMRCGAAIALAKPWLAERIVRRILAVENAVYATPECRNIAIGHALNALHQVIPSLAHKASVIRFAARQLTNSRPATRKKADRFVRQWGTGMAETLRPRSGRSTRPIRSPAVA